MTLTQTDLNISTLGPEIRPSPLRFSNKPDDELGGFVSQESRIRYQLDAAPGAPHQDLTLEPGGPRKNIFFDPGKITAAVVTCGGLCPGINNVIRSLYLELRHNYGITRIIGIRNGYRGLDPKSDPTQLLLTEREVAEIHKLGGTILGTSRGLHPPEQSVDFMQAHGIDILFCVGGDGTQRGAHAIAKVIKNRNAAISVVGIPKTVDNDIPYVYQTFGYATALEIAQEALRSAHTEAKSVVNGIGLVRLMGRHAGFIAAGASLASTDTHFVLVPEVRFALDGAQGLLNAIEKRLSTHKHAVIAVAEGAGQDLFGNHTQTRDESGNLKAQDIGTLLRDRITTHFETRNIPVVMKYIDPSYMIRSVPANTQDRLLSDRMARFAAHAAMAGRTDMLIGHWNNAFVHIPIPTAIHKRKRMRIEGDLWTNVLLATRQPRWPAS